SSPRPPSSRDDVSNSRPITTHYADPLEVIWLACARSVGWKVHRCDDVFAAFDGVDTLTIATAAELDPDDTLAQMILHEICHALVGGPRAMQTADYGLENADDRDLVYEHACHRLQAALADPYGLRGFFAVTTEWRPYFDALPADPLGDGTDPAIALAQSGWIRARSEPWEAAIAAALEATAQLAGACRPFAAPTSLWQQTSERHPLGGPVGPSSETCGSCAWRSPADQTCLMRDATPVTAAWASCERWEAQLKAASCVSCGACCREAFHLVEVGEDESFVRLRPEWVIRDAHGLHVPRPSGRCVALDPESAQFLCRVYADRPTSCRDFAVGSDSCLLARQRLGLSWRRFGRR
ncbi:MAG: hypothetical protein ACI9MR_004642, partial [Myxococcota bacterium]